MTALVALVAGVLFGAGLLLSGMTNPANVIAFLDVGGAWRPSLAFTMAAAIAVAAPAFAVARARARARAASGAATAVERRRIDAPLLLGSGLFGVGWGLSGICPGPGVVLLASGAVQALVFIAGFIVGATLERIAARRR